MILSIFPKIGLVVLLLVCAITIEAHTWIEEIYRIASNGTFVGAAGYPRGFTPRVPGVSPDLAMEYLLPPNGRPTGNAILSTDLMCKSSQSIGQYTPGSNMLNAAAGDFIALTYNENGHVTLPTPTVRPSGNGTVYVYGTKTPSNNDTFLSIHKLWNADGTGGNQRGKLLATRYFDDGQCYQTTTDNDSKIEDHNYRPLRDARRKLHPADVDQILCQTDVQVPTDAGTSGSYTMYWVWDFAHLDPSTGAVAVNETYTTCLDVGLTAEALPSVGKFNTTQLVTSQAIEEQLEKAMLVNPTAALVLPGGSPATVPQSSSAAASKPTATPAPSAPKESAVASSSPPSQGFITVTVTTTVHDLASAPAPSASTSSHSTPAISSVVVPSVTQGNLNNSGQPAVSPFLAAAASSQNAKKDIDSSATLASACSTTAAKIKARHPHRRSFA
ncbi:hypothetical protein LSUE1_G002022 [Lachnellula suecica]|uniref:DUF7492 domain-containing protein n=1 Tax=Lachnellula suecica TaxID=602035 RepID=A0A8T9CB60_9HELO|nr:hypothetical protein LSUE1_G002022 [Lachnellula suecica]